MDLRKSQIILHIPHSTSNIPDFSGYVADTKTLEHEVLKLTDWYTEELFYTEKAYKVKDDFSRIFCDVERFADDKKEEMAVFGMACSTIKVIQARLSEK